MAYIKNQRAGDLLKKCENDGFVVSLKFSYVHILKVCIIWYNAVEVLLYVKCTFACNLY